MEWTFKEIETGDVVRVNMGSYHHYGICTGDDRIVQFGLPVINLDESKVEVCATDIDTFLNGRFAEVMVLSKKEKKKANSTNKIIEKAEKSLGEKGYHILYNNCEHFVNRCVFNESICTQTEQVRKMISAKLRGE